MMTRQTYDSAPSWRQFRLGVVLACLCTGLGILSLVRGSSQAGHVSVVVALVLVWAVLLYGGRRLRQRDDREKEKRAAQGSH